MPTNIDPWISGAVIALFIGGAGTLWIYLSNRAFIRKYGPDPR
jgi:hypothetical protein